MSSVKRLDITLKKSKCVYMTGETVEGLVTVELFHALKTKVCLQIQGSAKVHWTETCTISSDTVPRSETVHFSAKESYFKHNIVLFEPASEYDFIPLGRHEYPFSITLPCDIPTSFESIYGFVRYYIRVKLDQPWKFDHYKWKVFTVLNNLDLNRQPLAALSMQGQDSTNTGILCCKSGPVSGLLHIDRAGYVPGDTIYVNAEICNNSSKRVLGSSIKLIMTTVYQGTTSSKTVNKCLASFSRGQIAPHESDAWSELPVQIAALPPSYLTGCSIIDVDYILQLEIYTSTIESNMSIPLEVIIGTTPLRSAMPKALTSVVVPDIIKQPLSVAAFMADNQNKPKAPPACDDSVHGLTYIECALGEVDVADEDETEDHVINGDTSFAPLYPYYDWSKF